MALRNHKKNVSTCLGIVWLNMFGGSMLAIATLKICWLCGASKGATPETRSMVYTDVSGDAPWRTSYLQCGDPWSTPPPYTSLKGFHISMIMADLLHVYNLGVGRDIAGCILRTILKDDSIFPGTIDQRLEQATTSLKRFAKTHGHCLHLKRLSRSKIGWKQKQYPELAAKGYDCYVVNCWLEELLGPHSDTYGSLATLLYCSNRAIRVLYAADMFPTDAEKNTVRVLGELFSKTFVELAWEAVEQHELMWRCRPKFHVFTELLFMRRRVNPTLYATWMDEDFLRKMGHTLELTSARTAQARLLQRWLLRIPEQLRMVEAEQA